MYYYIVNPSAGRSRIQKVQNELKTALGRAAIAGNWAKTTGSEDIKKLSQLAKNQGFTTIVAVGGDATVKEVVGALVGSSTALGIVPVGKTNQLAEVFGIKSWREAASVLATRRFIEVPVVETDRSTPMIYSLNIGRARPQHKLFPVRVVVDKNVYDRNVWALKVTNGFFLDRAELKIEFFEDETKILYAKSLQISSPFGIAAALDGETIPSGPIGLTINPLKKIKVIVGRERNF